MHGLVLNTEIWIFVFETKYIYLQGWSVSLGYSVKPLNTGIWIFVGLVLNTEIWIFVLDFYGYNSRYHRDCIWITKGNFLVFSLKKLIISGRFNLLYSNWHSLVITGQTVKLFTFLKFWKNSRSFELWIIYRAVKF